jgi:hypothetical protein
LKPNNKEEYRYMKDYEQQDCQLFNTGRFNDIVYAYFVMAARQAKTPNEAVVPLLAALEDVLHTMSAEEALERFRGGIQ